MKKVKLGIIGAGGIARQHLNVIKDIDWIEPVGITSRTRAKAECVAQEYGIPVCTDDMDSLIKKVNPDALMILVSVEQMYNVVLKSIPYGLPLFIEKPPGLIPEETRILVELAQKYSVSTMVGFNRRYYSIFYKGLQIIKNHGPLLGVLVEGHERMWLHVALLQEKIRSHWIYANSTHTIDLLRFFGGNPKELKSIMHKYIESNGDQFAAIMELESGAIGQYFAHWYSPGGWRVVLYGDGVTVEFKPLEEGRWIDRKFKNHIIEPDEVDKVYKTGFFKQMEAFGRMVRDGIVEWPMLNLQEAYKTMLLAEQIASNSIN